MGDAKPANNGEQYIFCAYVVRNGKVIYPKNAKVFRIPLSRLKKRKR
ncbi:MAG: hypothetical protein WBW16_05355 [Bacteroidota bacterium]